MKNEDYQHLLKISGKVYKFTLSSLQNEALLFRMSSEDKDTYNLQADLTNLIDMDSNWKRFDSQEEVKELFVDCLSTDKYKINFVDDHAVFELKTIFIKKEAVFTLKLKKEIPEKKETTDGDLKEEICILSSKLENLEKQLYRGKRFQLIHEALVNEYEFKKSEVIQLDYSTDVQFNVNLFIYEVEGCSGEWVYINFSCYNEDLKEETAKDKKVGAFHCYNKQQHCGKSYNFKFIHRLSCGKNRIEFSFSKASKMLYHGINVIAKTV